MRKRVGMERRGRDASCRWRGSMSSFWTLLHFALLFVVLLAVPAKQADAQTVEAQDLQEVVALMLRLNVPQQQVAARIRRMKTRQPVPAELRDEIAAWGASPLVQQEMHRLIERSRGKGGAAGEESAKALPATNGYVRRSGEPILDGERAVMLETVRLYAEDYSDSIPNFLCVRNTDFYMSKTGVDNWKRRVQLRERLVHLEDGDHQEVTAVDGKEVQEGQRVFASAGGITVSGEFGNILRRIFEEKTQTHFYWLGEEPGAGDRRVVIGFSVEKERSSMQLTVAEEEITSGYDGQLVASGETGRIYRVQLAMHESPEGYPIRGAAWDIRYAPVTVDDKEMLLPRTATTEAYQAGGVFLRNEATYTKYQKYAAESNIEFGGAEVSEASGGPNPRR